MTDIQRANSLAAEDVEHHKPERTATSFGSTTSSSASAQRKPNAAVMELESYPPQPASDASPTQRPRVLTRIPSVQTRYMGMLLHLDEIPRLHNILSSLFTWILLAGFLVIPGTFTTFKNSSVFKNADDGKQNAVEDAILHSVANVGLLYVSGICCGIGAIGACWLWFRWRQNYVWLINKIFFPAMLNSIAGLLTTLVNVYTAQKGVFSITAKITAIVTGSCAGITLTLFVLYNNWLLKKVRTSHVREFRPEDQQKPEQETPVEKVKRKARESAFEPGSIV